MLKKIIKICNDTILKFYLLPRYLAALILCARAVQLKHKYNETQVEAT